MAEAANEAVDPQACANGVNVNTGLGHHPESAQRTGAEAGIEEVRGVGVARVGPSANGLTLAVVVLVNELVNGGLREKRA